MDDVYCSEFDELLFTLGFNNEYMPEEYFGELFHYTSPAGFLSILSGDSSNTTIWASRYDCLNDASEGNVAYSVYQEVCEELIEQKAITPEIFSILTTAKPAKNVTIRVKEAISIEVKELVCNRYICSFSKNKDSLAMWNYYSKGNKYEGFNIGFSSHAVDESLWNYLEEKEADFHIYPIIYKKSEQKKLVFDFLNAILSHKSILEKDMKIVLNNVAEQLTLWELIFKEECFQHEEEVRIIVDVAKRDTNIAIKYRINAGFIIPYIELKLHKHSVLDVSFGPLQYSDHQKNHQLTVMKEMLNQCGYHTNVVCSEIPVRY